VLKNIGQSRKQTLSLIVRLRKMCIIKQTFLLSFVNTTIQILLNLIICFCVLTFSKLDTYNKLQIYCSKMVVANKPRQDFTFWSLSIQSYLRYFYSFGVKKTVLTCKDLVHSAS